MRASSIEPIEKSRFESFVYCLLLPYCPGFRVLLSPSCAMEKKVALITGATSGIGVGLIEKLLMQRAHIHICITGRNRTKLDSVLTVMKLKYPEADLSSVTLDVSDARSVVSAAEEIQSRFHRLDYVFLNAGMMPQTHVNWLNVVKNVFAGKGIHMFLTGDGMLDSVGEGKTRDGLSETFATNVFGHYLLVTELESILGGVGDDHSQLIWTSSGSALANSFDETDVTCSRGKQAYGSSKYCMDALSVALNERWNSKGIYSHVVCPGVVVTSMTQTLLPSWLWYILMPLFFFLRIVIRNFTLTLEAGTTGLVWLTKTPPDTLDYRLKIFTRATWFGPYLDFKKIDIDDNKRELIVDQLNQIRRRVLQQLGGSETSAVN